MSTVVQAWVMHPAVKSKRLTTAVFANPAHLGYFIEVVTRSVPSGLEARTLADEALLGDGPLALDLEGAQAIYIDTCESATLPDELIAQHAPTAK